MSNVYLWAKALHIIFVAAWFAGLFYMPRIFVNLAMVPADSHAERERLLIMGRKLYSFSTILMVPALVLGLFMWEHFKIGRGSGEIWMHIKLSPVAVVIAYHLLCRKFLITLDSLHNRRSPAWFRVFNEVSVLMFAAIVILVVFKPMAG